MANERSNCYTCLLYPDSAPCDWGALLGNLHVPAAVSPLHDRDLNEDGDFKKPHYHVVLKYNSLKSFSQARADFESFGGVFPSSDELFNLECRVRSIPSMFRYLCHLDVPISDPYKPRYNPADVKTFSGLDFLDEIAQSGSYILITQEILSWLNNTPQCSSFSYLVQYASREHSDWLPVLIRNPYFFRSYLGK